MVPGAKFRTKAGNVYQISEIDEWGNFECVELGLFCISALVSVRFSRVTDAFEIDRHNLQKGARYLGFITTTPGLNGNGVFF